MGVMRYARGARSWAARKFARPSTTTNHLSFVARMEGFCFPELILESSKQDSNDAHHQFFRGENREQEWKQGYCGDHGQTCNFVNPEWQRLHLAHDFKAVAQIGERLNVRTAQELLGSLRFARDPSSFEVVDIALRQQTVIGQSFSFRSRHLWGKHQKRAKNCANEENDKADDLQFE